MNRVYKIIWNAARSAYVVVSELASKKDTVRAFGSKSRQKLMQKAAVLSAAEIFALSLLSAGGQLAYAAEARGVPIAYYHYAAVKADSSNTSTAFNAQNTYVYVTENNQIVTANSSGASVYTGEHIDQLGTGTVYINGAGYYWDSSDSTYDAATGEYKLKPESGSKTVSVYKYRLSDDKSYYYRENYTGTLGTGAFTPLSDDQYLNVTYTGSGDPPTTIMYDVTADNDRQTGLTTNLNESLQSVNAGAYAAATDGVGVTTDNKIDGTGNFIIKDANWAAIKTGTDVSKGGYVNLKNSSGTPDGFVTVTNDSTPTTGLYWNASTDEYLYNGTHVSDDNIYVINGKVGVFTTGTIDTTTLIGDQVYTGTVYGQGNGVLLTDKQVGNRFVDYTSYWSVQETDNARTMSEYAMSDYNQDLTTLVNNDSKLLKNDISHVGTAATAGANNTNSATISLYRNGTNNLGTELVDGAVTLAESGGSGGISNVNSGSTGTGTDRTLTLTGLQYTYTDGFAVYL